MLNTAKAGGIGGKIIKWSHEKCKEESLKYNFRDDFRKSSVGAYAYAYAYARKHYILDDICSHMVKKPRPTAWTQEDGLYLTENYKKGYKYCTEKLNRTVISIKNKVHMLDMRKNIK